MRIPSVAVLLTALAQLLLSPPSFAQGLADVAKQEEARRHTAKGDGRGSPKVYTNKDLQGGPERPAVEAKAPAPAASQPANAGATEAAPSSSAAKAASNEVRNEAHWRKRMQALRDQLERDRMLAAALENRVSTLTADFTNRDDPAQRAQIAIERQKAIAELERMQSAVVSGSKAIADLEEEARRAGVPPGWVR